MDIPDNKLDRAIRALCRSVAASPQFYRALAEGELCALMPYHPEVEGTTIEIRNGMKNPFIVLPDKEGEIVLIFSSVERAEEGMRRGGVAERTYLPGEMPAKQLLGLIGQMGLRALINKSCTTGEVIIPANLMRDLAEDRVFSPSGPSTHEQFQARLVPPAEYPTDLLQPVFEILRQYPGFRAAWVVDRTPAKQASGAKEYGLMLLMQPRDEKLAHEVTLVAQAAGARCKLEVQVGLLDETNAEYIASFHRVASPFYQAIDYQPPRARRRSAKPRKRKSSGS